MTPRKQSFKPKKIVAQSVPHGSLSLIIKINNSIWPVKTFTRMKSEIHKITKCKKGQ